MSNLTKYEQETIIIYNQEEKTATCYTHNPTLIRKLEALRQKDTSITLIRADNGAKEYKFPKKYIKINAPRQLSDEQREKLANRMKNIRKDNNDE